MILFFRIAFLALLITRTSPSLGQNLKINELMASNATSITDEDGDHSDWIEIYNADNREINLIGYGLSDDKRKPFKWLFPNFSLEPGEFLVVFASDKDRDTHKDRLHTNFKISADGEEIVLTSPEGTLIDEIGPQNIFTDISYGRVPDGGPILKFFTQPSPGAANEGQAFGSLLQAPEFSRKGGFYGGPFGLSLLSSDPDVTIIYTTDGSTPDPAQLSGNTYNYKNSYPESPYQSFGELLSGTYRSFTYSAPLEIRDRTPEANIYSRISTTFAQNPNYFPGSNNFKGTVVKARAFKADALPSEVITHTYFVSPDVNFRYSIPVVSLSASPVDLFDYEKGIYVAGADFDNWRQNDAQSQPNGSTPANYRRSGDNWEIPAHLEIFDGEKGQVIAQDIGVRIHGGWTRASPAKSLRLYARNEYGESHFDYPIFPSEPSESYKRLILRNSGNDFGYSMFRDAAIHSIVGHMDIETMAYQPVVLFINSEYWGIHNFRERYDKHYFSRIYGADPDNLDILEGHMVVDEGSATHYKETIGYISEHGLKDQPHYEYIKKRIDVDNFMDYQIAQIYAGNSDWPGNNIKYWRVKEGSAEANAPKQLDGRWRWLLYDTDFGFNLYSDNAYTDNLLRLATDPQGGSWPNPPWSTLLFRRLLENEDFKNSFINRFSDQLNTAFRPGVVKEKINALSNRIAPEIGEHIYRWKSPYSLSSWERAVNRMMSFADLRPNYQWAHLKDHFNLADTYSLQLDVSHSEGGYIKVNTIELKEGTEGLSKNIYPWSGNYFRNLPVEVEAIPANGYVFAGWEGNSSANSKITIEPDADITLIAKFSDVVSGLETGEENRVKLIVFPNPTTGNAEIKITTLKRERVKISVHDFTGKLIDSETNQVVGAGIHQFSIQSALFENGIYIIRCELNDYTIHRKLIKE